MGVWGVGILNQSYIMVLKLKQKFKKNKVVTGKSLFSVIGAFCSYYSIFLNIGL